MSDAVATNNRIGSHEATLLRLKAECHDLMEVAEGYQRGFQQALAAVQAKRQKIAELKAELAQNGTDREAAIDAAAARAYASEKAAAPEVID